MRKELQELLQNRRLLPVLIIPPVVQLFVLGHAASTDVTNVPMIVADGDRSTASRDLIARFDASPTFTSPAPSTTVAEVDPALERGIVPMALSIPAGYGEEVEVGPRRDGADCSPTAATRSSTTAALGYATGLVRSTPQELQRSRGAAIAAAGGIEPRVRVWFNPQLESRFFMVPGVLALLLLVVTAEPVVDGDRARAGDRHAGAVERHAAPALGADRRQAAAVRAHRHDRRGAGARRGDRSGSRCRCGAAFLCCSRFTLLYLLCTLGLGLFVSTISQTQQQAMMTTVFFFLMPMIYLSGFIFPIENMPAVVQPFTYLIPLRYYLVVVRGIFLKGVGLDTLWPQAVGLAAWAASVLALAIVRVNKRAR